MIATLYYIVAMLLYIVASPFFIYLRFKPKYKDSLPARFFLKSNSSFTQGGVWFHACSLGEVRSLKPLIENITTEHVHISVITQTGFHEAGKIKNVEVRYLPFEIFLPFWIREAKVLVVMEAELWPLLFIVAKAKGMKTILMNARISDKSYASYHRFRFIYRWIFSYIDVVFAQSEGDKERLVDLGAQRVHISGNIKTFQQLSLSRHYPKRPGTRVIVLASTHEKEEELILEKIKLHANDQLIVVPRHPERFKKVNDFLQEFCINHQRTYARIQQDDTMQADIILCDTMGELVNVYAIADIVILGGSFIDGIGGHNPLEPAFFGVKIISGKYIFNQKVLFNCIENIEICEEENLRNVFEKVDTLKNSMIINSGQIEPLIQEILGT
ncbi:MAG: lipid IV(A) 3-deoxy-D-manno-octulosonic acid transferase [Sulfurospirillaceae bacterium]|nr:lipid IV(A) 3-deoxy-D-manno-octulosonic acid transferase [Sulfurospirillaceae bacterium]